MIQKTNQNSILAAYNILAYILQLSMQQPNNRQLHQMPLVNQRDTTWDHLYTSLKLNEKYSELGKNDVLRKRMAKFFTNNNVSSPEGDRYYMSRRDNNMSEQSMLNFSSNSILLYGVDFFNERRIEQYFSPFMVTVDSHDDSHCSVIFQSTECLIAAIYKALKNSSHIAFEEFKANFLSNSQYLVQWNELLPYYQLSSQRKLWFRILTEWDQKNKVQSRQSDLKKTYFFAKHNLLTVLRQPDQSLGLEEENNPQIGNQNVNMNQKYNKKVENNRLKLTRNDSDKSSLNSSSEKHYNKTKSSYRKDNFRPHERQNAGYRRHNGNSSRQNSMQSNRSRSRSRDNSNHYHNHNQNNNSHHCLANMLQCNCFKQQLIMHLNNNCSSHQRHSRNQSKGYNMKKNYQKSRESHQYDQNQRSKLERKRWTQKRAETKASDIMSQHSSISEQKGVFSDDQQHDEVQNLLKEFNKYQLFQKQSELNSFIAEQNVIPNQASNSTRVCSLKQQSHH